MDAFVVYIGESCLKVRTVCGRRASGRERRSSPGRLSLVLPGKLASQRQSDKRSPAFSSPPQISSPRTDYPAARVNLRFGVNTFLSGCRSLVHPSSTFMWPMEQQVRSTRQHSLPQDARAACVIVGDFSSLDDGARLIAAHHV
jgi:hypothetical protein